MNPLDLTVNQLKRAAAIKEQIEGLNKELRGIFGAPASTRAAPRKKRMSAAAKKQLAAARKARWAHLRRANPAMHSVTPGVRAKKKTVSPATKAKLSAKLKAYWAAKKKSSKK
jgi:hypothetical protein